MPEEEMLGDETNDEMDDQPEESGGTDGSDQLNALAAATAKKAMLAALPGCLPIMGFMAIAVLIVVVFAGVLSPIESVVNYFDSDGASTNYGEKKTDEWSSFKDSDPTTATFYKALSLLAKLYDTRYGIKLDVALISSAIFYQSYINPSEDDLECIEKLETDEDGNVISRDCVGDVKKSKISASKIYKEAIILADGMIQDERLVSDDEYKRWLKDNYMEDKFKDLGIKISSDATIKEKAFDKAIAEIYQFRDIYLEITYGKDEDNYATAGTCDYQVNGKLVRDVKVELLSCDGSKVVETIDFDKYVKGVVFAENRGAPDEAIKAQAVAARSYALTRQTAMCPGNPDDCNYGYNATKNIIRMRGCENDQVYCDPDKGCTITSTTNESYGTVRTWEQGKREGGKHIAPFVGAAKKRFDDLIDSVAGMTIVDSSKNVFYAGFTSTDQNAWAEKANLGNKFDKILLEHYGKAGAKNISAACSATDDIVPGVKFPIAEKFYSANCYSAGRYYPGNVYHGAIDFAHNSLFAGVIPEASPVRITASIAGEVVVSGTSTRNTYPACMNKVSLKNDGLGYRIKVTDEKSKYFGYTFVYWHLDTTNPDIQVGTAVKQGDYLGTMGNTGCSSGKHLHFQVIDKSGNDVILDSEVDKYCDDHVAKE